MSAPTDARICPYCGSKHSRTQESKLNRHDGYLIRYRLCNRCKRRWRTYEIRAEEWKSANVNKDKVYDAISILERVVMGEGKGKAGTDNS